jgi:serine/threonine protein kinase
MTAEAQRSFGPYQIKSSLGSGGMGEVFLAEDPRLRRNVAIKILPATLSSDSGRRARFLNEARAASALHHPHIVTIFDVGTENGVDFLVMEYVEGRTLREVMSRRPMPARAALDIAAQVASGLAAAHAAGIVHRDIKPENIMVARDGAAKILDYGLAKLTENEVHTNIETDVQLTKPGVVVGTVAYMSPEQIEGKPVDHRSDIFSLGVVLYEMLTGRKQQQPDVDQIAALSPRVREILVRTLARDPSERYQHAGDMQLDLRRAMAADDVPSTSRAQRRAPLFVAALIAVAAIAITGAIVFSRRAAVAMPKTRMSFVPLTSDPGYEGEPTFSPDGQTIAYVSDRTGNLEIFLKQVSGGPEINLTNNPADDVQPAFSPDGKQIAFVSTRRSETQLVFRNPTVSEMGGDIWVMPAFGGVPRRIVEGGNFPAWAPDGSVIIFVRGPWLGQRMFKVAPSGGEATELPIHIAPVKPLYITHPSFSADGKWITFDAQEPDNIYVVASRGGNAVAVAHGRDPAWMPDSRSIVYSDLEPGRNATLSRVPIAEDGRAAGPPEPLTSGRGEDKTPAIARDGKSLVYGAQNVAFNIERVAFDADRGKTIGAPEPITRGSEVNPLFNVSPDGRAVVFQSQRGLSSSIWRQDLNTGAVTQLSGDDWNTFGAPVWSPDGKQIAFTRTRREGQRDIWVMSSDGGNPRFVVSSGGFPSWTPDGRGLAYLDFDRRVVRLLDLTAKTTRVLANEGTIRTLQEFTADGKWMVYQAIGEKGVIEVRVVSTNSTRSRIIVSDTRENMHPFFSPDSKWVYFGPNHKNIYRVPGPAQGWKSAPPQQVTFFPESNLYLEDPQLSADGKYFYFSRRSISSDLWLGRFEQ